MADKKNPQYKFLNGKNVNGGSTVGDRDRISEQNPQNKTGAKYVVGNETVSADNLQKD